MATPCPKVINRSRRIFEVEQMNYLFIIGPAFFNFLLLNKKIGTFFAIISAAIEAMVLFGVFYALTASKPDGYFFHMLYRKGFPNPFFVLRGFPSASSKVKLYSSHAYDVPKDRRRECRVMRVESHYESSDWQIDA